jgi:hypothetical protein
MGMIQGPGLQGPGPFHFFASLNYYISAILTNLALFSSIKVKRLNIYIIVYDIINHDVLCYYIDAGLAACGVAILQ